MTRLDIVVETPVSSSPRARQLEALFDVPYQPTSKIEWHGDLELDAEPWNVGLIVGPSGSGKSTVKRALFGKDRALKWAGASVIDDFPADVAMDKVTAACQAVGFNTIPAWLRPYSVLSTGEQFRADLARRLLSDGDPIVVDEFTSVVDRQVAKIGSHAVQKYVRRASRRFVAVSCHYDIIDWLQPDWVFEPATWNLTRRPPRGRPELDCSISTVPYSAWRAFAPYHYLTASLHKAARCFVLFVGDRPAAFTAVMPRPISRGRGGVLYGFSRTVTLPDWQGLGLAFVLTDRIAALYGAQGFRVRAYPAHPAYVRVRDRSPHWRMTKRPGHFSSRATKESFGGRPCAVFEYIGASGDPDESRRMLGDLPHSTLKRTTKSAVASR